MRILNEKLVPAAIVPPVTVVKVTLIVFVEVKVQVTAVTSVCPEQLKDEGKVISLGKVRVILSPVIIGSAAVADIVYVVVAPVIKLAGVTVKVYIFGVEVIFTVIPVLKDSMA